MIVAYDEILAKRVKKVLEGMNGLTEKEKMGGLSFMIARKVLTRIEGNRLIVRCKPEETEILLLRPHASRYQMKGKTQMKGWLTITPKGTKTIGDLKFWLDTCIAFHDLNAKG